MKRNSSITTFIICLLVVSFFSTNKSFAQDKKKVVNEKISGKAKKVEDTPSKKNIQTKKIRPNENKRSYVFYHDSEIYFDNEKETYIYHEDNEWIESKSLPADVNEEDLENDNTSTIYYKGDDPYTLINQHKNQLIDKRK